MTIPQYVCSSYYGPWSYGLEKIFPSTYQSITNVTIQSSVTSLGEYLFEGCVSLTNVTIPDSVTSIGPSAFNGCSGLRSAVIPAGVTRIEDHTFDWCRGLSEVVIPEGVAHIGMQAFSGCTNLASIVIPSSVTSIGGKVFNNGSYTYYSAFTDCSNIRDVTIPQYVCSSRLSDFFPASYQKITNVTMSAGVKSIGNYAFTYCYGLRNVTIPNSVTSIGQSAFSSCTNLTDLSMLPDSVTSIGQSAFNGCSGLRSAVIPAGVTRIEEYAFFGCSGLRSAVIPGGVKRIANQTFSRCYGLSAVVISEGVEYIGTNAFYCCTNLTSVAIPSSVTFIGNGTPSSGSGNYSAFSGCSRLLDVTIPQYVCSLANGLYKIFPTTYQSITNVVILNGVKSIGQNTFSDCKGLKNIEIPDSVKSIGRDTFSGRTSLADLSMLPDSVTSIGESAFSGCSGLRSAVIPGGVKRIANNTFRYCYGLAAVTIPEGVEYIGTNAFYCCTNLTSVVIPTSVTFIGSGGNYSAFNGCSRLLDVTIPQYVCSLANGLYKIFPATYQSITNVTIQSGVKSIGQYLFQNCTTLTSLTIPSSVTSIDYRAFYGCKGLSSLFFEGNAPTVGGSTFSNVGSGCTAYVKHISMGWGVSIPGTWKGIRIEYVDPEPVWTVTFDANGGTVAEMSRSVTNGCAVGELPVPTNGKYHFDGWFTDAEGGRQVSSGAIVTYDVTFHAQWHWPLTWQGSRNAAVQDAAFMASRILLVSGPETCTNTAFLLNTVCEAPSIRARLNGRFVSWYNNSDNQFEEVRGYADGLGDFETPLVCILDPWDMSTYVARTNGWMDVEGFAAFLDGLPPAEEREPSETCRVTFDPQGGDLGTTLSTIRVPYGGVVGALPVPTREGCSFVGWFTGKQELVVTNHTHTVLVNGLEVTPKTVVTDDVTYRAVWSENPVSLSLAGPAFVHAGTPSFYMATIVLSNGSTNRWGEQIHNYNGGTDFKDFSSTRPPSGAIAILEEDNIKEEWKCCVVEGESYAEISSPGKFYTYGFRLDTFSNYTPNATVDVSFAVSYTRCGVMVGTTNTVKVAVYIPPETVSVTFNGKPGSGTMEDQIFVPGVSQKLNANQFAPPAPGYYFCGWYGGTGDRVYFYSDKEEITTDHNLTLRAYWQRGFVTNVIDGNLVIRLADDIGLAVPRIAPNPRDPRQPGDARQPVGGGNDDGQESNDDYEWIQIGGTAATPIYAPVPVPTRPGYEFVGWWTEGGTQVTAGTVVTEDMTLYAHWRENPHPDDGTGDGGTAGDDTPGGDTTVGGVLPWTAKKAVTLDGAVYDADGKVAGVVQLKVAKPNVKKHNAKISGSVTLLDGKKRALKAAAFNVPADKPISANLNVKGLGTLSLVIGDDGFEGTVGGYTVARAKVGGNWTRADSGVYTVATSGSLPPGTIEDLLPDGEPVRAKGGKWAFDKAASIKYAKGVLSGDNDPKKPNLSAMKLTYTPKTGLFKGSFKLYALQGGKLKKFTVKITGVVVDGEGAGVAKLAKPAVTWSVSVR